MQIRLIQGGLSRSFRGFEEGRRKKKGKKCRSLADCIRRGGHTPGVGRPGLYLFIRHSWGGEVSKQRNEREARSESQRECLRRNPKALRSGTHNFVTSRGSQKDPRGSGRKRLWAEVTIREKEGNRDYPRLTTDSATEKQKSATETLLEKESHRAETCFEKHHTKLQQFTLCR